MEGHGHPIWRQSQPFPLREVVTVLTGVNQLGKQGIFGIKWCCPTHPQSVQRRRGSVRRMIRLLFLAFAASGSRLPEESARRPPNIPDNADGRRTITLKPSTLDSLSSPAVVTAVREPGVSTISLQLAGDQTFPQPPVAQDDSLPTITVGNRVFGNGNRVFRVPSQQKVLRQEFQPRVPFITQRIEKVREEVKPLPVVSVSRQPAFASVNPLQDEGNEEGFQPYSFQFEVADDESQTYHARQEEADGSGEVRGVYSYVDPFGSLVTVTYRAGVGGYQETREVVRGFLEPRLTPVRDNFKAATPSRSFVRPQETFSSAGIAEPVNLFSSPRIVQSFENNPRITQSGNRVASRSSRRQFTGGEESGERQSGSAGNFGNIEEV